MYVKNFDPSGCGATMAKPDDDFLAQIRRFVFPKESNEASDGQLLTRFVEARDAEAAAVLVRRHSPMVWGVCRRLLVHSQDVSATGIRYVVSPSLLPLMSSIAR